MAKTRDVLLRDIGESKLIGEIRNWLGDVSPPAPHGIGDDCAVIPASRARQLITVDPVIGGRHFDLSTPAAAVAEKLLKRNISDIAAMGGTPRNAVVAIAAPADLRVSWLREFYRGLAACAKRHGINIVGGDVAQTEGHTAGPEAFLTLVGDAPARPLTRTGARAGDLLFVTGALGGSILGRHLRFTPRLEEGRWLAARREVHAAIDVSDGLGKDLGALIPANCIIVVDTTNIPVGAAARKLARMQNRDALDCALNDGEDYELLFAVAPRRVESLIIDWHKRFETPLSCIGRFIASHAPTGRGAPVRFVPELPRGVSVRGYEHFR